MQITVKNDPPRVVDFIVEALHQEIKHLKDMNMFEIAHRMVQDGIPVEKIREYSLEQRGRSGRRFELSIFIEGGDLGASVMMNDLVRWFNKVVNVKSIEP